jgi:hypothetical protein
MAWRPCRRKSLLPATLRGGWYSPSAVTPARFVDAFERAGGLHSGFRRNHAKGVGVSGYFESDPFGEKIWRGVKCAVSAAHEPLR